VSRRERERALLEIVRERDVGTQAELAEALAERGFEVTQSTVSRDVRRLGLVKVPLAGGGVRWARPRPDEASPGARQRLDRLLREEVRSVRPGAALLAVETPPGSAGAVAAALDAADLPGLVATVAGDDTVLVLAEDDEARDRLVRRLRGEG